MTMTMGCWQVLELPFHWVVLMLQNQVVQAAHLSGFLRTRTKVEKVLLNLVEEQVDVARWRYLKLAVAYLMVAASVAVAEESLVGHSLNC
jgi:hypothetical protein